MKIKNRADYALFIEALFFLGCMRMLLLMLPFRHLARFLGQSQQQTPLNTPTEEQRLLLILVRKSLDRASVRAPWECKCLVRAMASMLMLKRRKMSSTLYLGVAKDKDNNLKAHAWLRSGDFKLCGFENSHEYTVITSFAQAVN